jgi:hypothetical protein
LSDLDRVHLLLALQATAKKEDLARRDTEYVNDLVKIVKSSPTHGVLSRGQIASAVEYQRMLLRFSSFSHKPPSGKQLAAVALASGLPFLGYVLCLVLLRQHHQGFLFCFPPLINLQTVNGEYQQRLHTTTTTEAPMYNDLGWLDNHSLSFVPLDDPTAVLDFVIIW